MAETSMKQNYGFKEILNYRVEHVGNGYILHITRGKDGATHKLVFTGKVELLDHLEKVLW